ncbi:MAG: putative heme-binding domain-containing protein [Verrucomicrobiales bacterium]|jgi:putative heme-binding domain-containing protein
MNFFRILILFAFGIPAIVIATEWVWDDSDRNRSAGNHVNIAKVFEIESVPAAARLTITSDFAFVEAEVNGHRFAEIEPYDPVRVLDVSAQIIKGENSIALICNSVEGPSAVAASLEFLDDQGDVIEAVETNENWIILDQGELRSVKTFGQVRPSRFAPNVLPDISQFEEYNQWREATEGTDANLSPLPPGFEIELIRAAQEGEDSWVSMAFDSKGRIIIGKEKKGLLRLTLPKEEGGEIKAETIDDTLLECRGLLWAYESIYVNANVGEGLYRLHDANGDDRIDGDEIELLKNLGRGGGHGRNDLALGPDGLIYSIHGDSVKIPEGDRLLTVPETEEANPKGHLARMDKDGKNWEVLNRGLRNPYGIAFNRDGEAFTYDADNEGDVGLPLYRPTRVSHLVAGANYGWQQSADPAWSWPVWAPDTWPTTCDIGRGSPTSIKFGYGTNFPQHWSEALYVLDWAYGRIISVRFTPRGASYYATADEFLRGRPLNVTDLEIGPDGAMYFVTGGRKTQAALYRISYSEDIGGSPPASTEHEIARAKFSANSRVLRRHLERATLKMGDLESHLGSFDPWIRGAARVAFEKLILNDEIEDSAPIAIPDKPTRFDRDRKDLAEATKFLAMVRTLEIEPGEFDEMLVKSARFFRSATLKLLLLRVIEMRGSESPDLLTQLEKLYPDKDTRVNRELCKVLVQLGSEIVVERTQQLLAASESQFDRLHYIERLSHAQTGWTPEGREAYFKSLLHAKRFTSGDRNLPGYLKRIQERALASTPQESREAFSALLADSQLASAPTPDVRPVVQQWKMTDFDDDSIKGGDPAKGRELFSASACDRCHQFGARGTPVGPDLTTVASRFNRQDLLRSIVTPSEVIAEPYRTYLITKKDGTTVLGRLIREDFRTSTLFISPDIFAPNELVEVSKHDIESYSETSISPMPPSLLDTLTREEILDLLAFLKS